MKILSVTYNEKWDPVRIKDVVLVLLEDPTLWIIMHNTSNKFNLPNKRFIVINKKFNIEILRRILNTEVAYIEHISESDNELDKALWFHYFDPGIIRLTKIISGIIFYNAKIKRIESPALNRAVKIKTFNVT